MTQRDLFMQFKYIQATTGADASTLTEGTASTGLSVRGGYAWLIHEVSVDIPKPSETDTYLNIVLAVLNGQGTMPDIDDKGVIERWSHYVQITTSGLSSKFVAPEVRRFQPPIIIANPTLSLYVQGSNDAALNNKAFKVRIGYTTIPMDQEQYLEIAETWETL